MSLTSLAPHAGRILLRGALASLVLSVAVTARADLAACIASSEQAISLRRGGKLHDARRQLVSCTASSCPDEVRTDCVKRMEAINAAMPSLVVGAKDGAGNDVLVAEVTIDGARVAAALDGRPIEVDPGEHTVRVEAKGLPPAERKLVIGEGEKARHEGFVLGAPVVVVAPVAPVVVTESRGLGTGRKVALVSGGLGIVGLGVGAVFGGLAASEWSSAKSDSKTAQASCSTAAPCAAQTSALSEHSTATTDATVSTIALGVGGALLVAGVMTWFFAPSRAKTDAQESTGMQLVPTALPGGGALMAVGRF